MKVLPVGRQNLKGILADNQLYVDKTRQVHDLVTGSNLYFLARPRRFGKTLLVSTFEYLFAGDKEVFQELYIAQKTNYDWQSYPTLVFSFNSYGYKVVNLRAAISRQLATYAQQFGVIIGDYSLTDQFRNLVIEIAKTGKPVVILVDEYDKPIVDFMTEPDQAQANQAVLKDFFSPLKDLDRAGHLRFLFITGVSKFSKVSLFSDLNNLVDLSVSPLAAELTGITQSEMLEYFSAYIERAAQQFSMSQAEVLHGIKIWYNGYSFDGETRLYNPFSLLSFFNSYEFGNFWFATGTPTFLVNLVRKHSIDPQRFETVIVSDTFFDKFSLTDLDITGLLFQTGYLTIKDVVRKQYKKRYTLGYPNLEVRNSLAHNLIEAFTYQSNSVVSQALVLMEEALTGGDVNSFIEQLKILLSDLSYFHIPRGNLKANQKAKKANFAVWEGYFHTIIYLITTFLGLEVKSEIAKHQGRLDLLAETKDYLYLMEFKLDEPAADAIQQIKNRKYAAAYRNTEKTLILVGVGFSRAARNVESWEQEVWSKL